MMIMNIKNAVCIIFIWSRKYFLYFPENKEFQQTGTCERVFVQSKRTVHSLYYSPTTVNSHVNHKMTIVV